MNENLCDNWHYLTLLGMQVKLCMKSTCWNMEEIAWKCMLGLLRPANVLWLLMTWLPLVAPSVQPSIYLVFFLPNPLPCLFCLLKLLLFASPQCSAFLQISPFPQPLLETCSKCSLNEFGRLLTVITVSTVMPKSLTFAGSYFSYYYWLFINE